MDGNGDDDDVDGAMDVNVDDVVEVAMVNGGGRCCGALVVVRAVVVTRTSILSLVLQLLHVPIHQWTPVWRSINCKDTANKQYSEVCDDGIASE